MNFEEPGLEDLIQNDLHNEMNRILSESDVDDLDSVSHSGHFYTTSEPSSVQSPLENDLLKVPITSSADVHPQQSTDELHPISTSLMHEAASTSKQEISGTFALHRVHSNDLPRISEHSDLSSLSWLTTVDMQNMQETSGNSALEQHLTAGQQQTLPTHQPCHDLLYDPNEQLSTTPHSSPTKKVVEPKAVDNTTRYTPIQPTYPTHEQMGYQQQRYHLHSEPANVPRGPAQYMYNHNPYAPPPIYPQGMGYRPYMHSRFHHNVTQKVFPKPVYSYSCLIAMALKHSKTGCLPVSDIYSYMMDHFPYFKTAPDGWKNSVRHNLSLNKCFEKASRVEKPNGTQRKGCLWALNPAKVAKMEEEVQKWKRKDPESVRRSMSKPEELDRELEEMRRMDEENARRRMLTLSTHGLTTHRPYHAPQHNQRKHFSSELAQHHLTLALARTQPHTNQQHNMHRQPQQEQLTADVYTQSAPVTPTYTRTLEFQMQKNGQNECSTSAQKEIDSASCGGDPANDFADIDLDASLADLAMLQSSFWEDDNISLESHDNQPSETASSSMATVSSTPVTTSVTSASFNLASEGGSEPKHDENFRNEMKYFSNNIGNGGKPVMLH